MGMTKMFGEVDKKIDKLNHAILKLESYYDQNNLNKISVFHINEQVAELQE